MIDLQQRIRRFARLREVQDRQLSAAAQELSTWDAKVLTARRQIETNQQEYDRAFAGNRDHSLHSLTQGVHWAAEWKRQRAELDEQIQELERHRSIAMIKVTENKKALQSWDALLERLGEELQSEQTRMQGIEAEEHYLRSEARSSRL